MEDKFNILKKPSIILLIFTFCFVLITMDVWRLWHYGQTNFSWDFANYYSYLPAYISNNGSFEFNNYAVGYMPINPTDNLHIPKATYAMSLMYLPSYAMGYKIAFNSLDPLDGFSEPFALCVHWGSILYSFLGLIVLRNFLIKFFNETITTLTLLVVFFGTPLFYYTVGESEMAHCYLFFLISAFLLITYHWHKKITIYKSILLGLIIGLISLIRPTEILVIFIFIFWSNLEIFDLKSRLFFFLKNYKQILLILLVIIIVWAPQLLFWKYRTGHYLYFSYPGERFFWNDPQIINVLFSYRKGWFVYTPLILLAFIGFAFVKKELSRIRNVILIITLFNIYMLSCWWDWAFGGGFSARAFTQHIAFLSIPIASIFNSLFYETKFKNIKKLLQPLMICVIFFGISLNIGQTYQYTNRIIHFDSMTKESYWLVFGKYKFVGNDEGKFWQSLKEPKYDKLRSGEDRDQ